MFVLVPYIPLHSVPHSWPSQTNSLNKQTLCTTITSLVTPTIPIGGIIQIFLGNQTHHNRTLEALTTLGIKTTLETRTTQEVNNLIVHYSNNSRDTMSHLGHNLV